MLTCRIPASNVGFAVVDGGGVSIASAGEADRVVAA